MNKVCRSRTSLPRPALIACTLLALCSILRVADTSAAPPLRQSITLDIPPGTSLESALITWGHEARVQIMISTKTIAHLKAPELHGTLRADVLLSTLLHGTGLTYTVDGDTIHIVRPDITPHTPTTPSAGALPAPGTHTSSNNFPSGGSQTDRSPEDPPPAQQRRYIPRSTGEPRDTASSAPAATLEEVIVTANKVEQRLIDVPASVSVLSSHYLTTLAATQFSDFANTVPGLSFTTAGAGFTQITLRGVTTGIDGSPTVGVYVDGIPYGSSTGFGYGSRLALNVGLFDIDRIEILRGPQGTLYGAGALGGVIKYVTQPPDPNSFTGSVQAGLSETDDGSLNYNGSAATNLPIVQEKAALRLSAYESHDGGYIDNVALQQDNVNRSDMYGGRSDLLILPASSISVRAGLLFQDISRAGQATADYTLSGIPEYGPLNQHRLFKEPFHQSYRLYSLDVTDNMPYAALTSITGYQTVYTRVNYDVSAVFVPALRRIQPYSAIGLPQTVSTDKFTQEIRLASSNAETLRWLIGGFYTHENTHETEAFSTLNLFGALVPNSLYNLSTPTTFDEYAAFGDLTLQITKRLEATGGLRYAKNHQDFTQIGSGLLALSAPTRASTGGVTTYLANILYHFSALTSAYLRYATGYRPGGPNYVATNLLTGLPTGPGTFQSDHLSSYEGGFKAETPDHQLGVDWSAYYIDWANIQVLTSRGGFGIRLNAPGGATIRGSELTLSLHPAAGLSASAALSYQDARMSQAAPLLGAASGERLPNVPKFTAALNSDYTIIQRGWHPSVGATVRYVSARMASFNGSTSLPQYRLPGYTTVDVRTQLDFGPATLQLYAHNILNRVGELSASTSYSILGGPAQVAIVEPRTIGVSVTASF